MNGPGDYHAFPYEGHPSDPRTPDFDDDEVGATCEGCQYCNHAWKYCEAYGEELRKDRFFNFVKLDGCRKENCDGEC